MTGPFPSCAHRALACLICGLVVAACGTASASAPVRAGGRIVAVGAENEYANVIAQIGGRYVAVSAIMSNPNTDPHTFEASPSIAQTVSRARLVVQNGLGYDDFMTRVESASPSASRRVIDVQRLLGLPDSDPNPHLWYSPRTMPAVARALVQDLSAMEPSHAAYFRAGERRFDASLRRWLAALQAFRTEHPGTAVASTEPVADDLLQAAGIANLTPLRLQADIMNGTDLAPQAVSAQDALFSGHRVKALIYNQQVTDTVTQSFLKAAAAAGIAVVGVYETMPTPGYRYQSWMLAELRAIERAVRDGTSTEKLGPR